MKNSIFFLSFATLAILTVMASGVRLEAQIYEYDWIGGKPGFSGKIFLNAPSSSSATDGGSIADVMVGSYLTTPLGTFPILDYTFSNSASFSHPNLLWDQTQITLAGLWFQSPTVIYDPYFGWPAEAAALVGWPGTKSGIDNAVIESGGGWATQTAEDDFTGLWLAVPEPSTFVLSAIGVLVLILMESCHLLNRRGRLTLRWSQRGLWFTVHSNTKL